MLKYIYIISIFLSSSVTVFSQQQEHYTQYQYNQFALNPALAGDKKCVDVKSGYRFQWVGIEGAPKSGFFSLTTPLKLGKKRRSPYAPKHGIGIQISRDQIGPWIKSEMHLNYALKISLSRYAKLSYGLSAGMKQVGFKSGDVTTANPDPTVFNAQRSIVFPDVKIGTWLTLKKSYFGFSIHNLFANKIKNVGMDNSYQPHFYFTMGKKFNLDKGWDLIPSVLIMKTKNTPFDLHLSAVFDYENKMAFGLGIRRTDAITAQVRFKLFNLFSIGYSFDFIISKLQNKSWQSQELTFSYIPCSNHSTYGPTSTPVFE